MGKPVWKDEDFANLLRELQCRGYGWLRPEGVHRELERMTRDWKSSPTLPADGALSAVLKTPITKKSSDEPVYTSTIIPCAFCPNEPTTSIRNILIGVTKSQGENYWKYLKDVPCCTKCKKRYERFTRFWGIFISLLFVTIGVITFGACIKGDNGLVGCLFISVIVGLFGCFPAFCAFRFFNQIFYARRAKRWMKYYYKLYFTKNDEQGLDLIKKEE